MGSSQKRRKTSKAPPAETPPAPTAKTSLPAADNELPERPSTPGSASASNDSKKDVTPIKSAVAEASSANQVSAGGCPPYRSPTDCEIKLKPKSSWYGTWPRKATASTQVARETILANKSSNIPSTGEPSSTQHKPSTTSTVCRPPSMTVGKGKETLDITMGGTFEEETKRKEAQAAATAESSKSTTNGTEEVPSLPKVTEEPEPEPEAAAARPTTSSGWLGGWLGSSTVQPITVPVVSVEAPGPAESAAAKPAPAEAPGVEAESDKRPTTSSKVAPPSSSWFGMWSTAPPSSAAEAPKEQIPVKLAENGQDTVMEDAPPAEPASQSAQPVSGSSWAFWSTAMESSKKEPAAPEKAEEPGELEVVGEPSLENPEPAKTSTKDSKKSKSSKRGKPESSEIAPAPTLTEPSTSEAIPPTSAAAKAFPPNLLIPSVKSTYRLCENPSILQQIARLLLMGQQKPVKHVSLVKDPPKIKNALAIGIHGLFPAPLLRTVIGQPTGTSIRFANHAASAIRRWTDAHGSVDCEIEKVALEGEGKIGERVDNLWKLLLNWIDHVRKADFILVACHSQGVPVAVMLVAKLIEFGVVSTGKIGICAMAGVSLGPFADYKSRLFSGSAGELFEFADPESVVSKRYEDSLRVALKYGVKVTYCGSIDDQLISMESSIFSNASHPYIYRAVFVDGRLHAPDFLSQLVGFALKLRNLGVSDHGLIRELSAPLAGSLYTGAGHSRLYDDGKVYDLAVEYALETTSVGDVPLDMKKYEIPTNANPYVLPWIMRGLLEEDFVKTELSNETTELLKQFDVWRPSTKVLKDVKYRLEAVRSKL